MAGQLLVSVNEDAVFFRRSVNEDAVFFGRSGGDGAALTPRLMIVSSRAKNLSVLQSSLQANVVFVQYKYEQTTLESLLGERLAQRKKHASCGDIHEIQAFVLPQWLNLG